VGNTLRYISQTQTTAASTTTVGTTANPTITVTTDKLDLGLKVDLSGDFEEDTVFTAVKIELSNLTELKKFSSGTAENSTQLELPQVNERSLETSVRVRPGDTILIAGIQQARDTKNSTGTPEIAGLSAQTYKAENAARSELVIVMRPRVIRFVPRSKMLQAGTMAPSYKSSESAAYGSIGGVSNQPGASVALAEPLSALPANKTPSLSTAAAPAEPLVPRNDLPQDALPRNLQAAPPIRNSLDGMVGLMNRAGN
jgi:Flp pilus assembly secretin CpaC